MRGAMYGIGVAVSLLALTGCPNDSTGVEVPSSVTVTSLACATIIDNAFERGYEVTAVGSVQGPVGAIISPSGGKGTSYNDPNKSGEAITDFTLNWTDPGTTFAGASRGEDDPETTQFSVSFETNQPKPLQAMTVFIDMDLFIPNGGGRKVAAKNTICQ